MQDITHVTDIFAFVKESLFCTTGLNLIFERSFVIVELPKLMSNVGVGLLSPVWYYSTKTKTRVLPLS